MDFEKLADKAKQYVDEHGGSDELKQEADKLKDIAADDESFADKAKAAGEVAKEFNANKTQ